MATEQTNNEQVSDRMPAIHVHLIPELVTVDELAGKEALVIDVLRATTTISYALANGATRVIPCLEVERAVRLAGELGDALLGGERGGERIDGFDLGNSPREYGSEVVRGKTIVFTTTNGTKAMQKCRSSKAVRLAAFANFSAVCDEVAEVGELHLVCAGTNQQITREDVLLAGALVDELLCRNGSSQTDCCDQATIARAAWRDAVEQLQAGPVASALRDSSGARNLIEIGQEEDIEIAAQIDRVSIVPRLDLDKWEIRAD
ncbi:MAG: 2-phosphosulfolactate phosphatase [Pirellulaceae bacterium]|nr:2-phosphosulfolactate phosphatase [Pirellulaceae bacterium]